MTICFGILILVLVELTTEIYNGQFGSTFTIPFANIRSTRRANCSSSSKYISHFPVLTTNTLCTLRDLVDSCFLTFKLMMDLCASKCYYCYDHSDPVRHTMMWPPLPSCLMLHTIELKSALNVTS